MSTLLFFNTEKKRGKKRKTKREKREKKTKKKRHEKQKQIETKYNYWNDFIEKYNKMSCLWVVKTTQKVKFAQKSKTNM